MRHSSTRARKRKKRGANKSTLIIAAIIALVILLGAGCGFIGATISNLPDVQQTGTPAASSQVFDIKGRLITTIHAEENRCVTAWCMTSRYASAVPPVWMLVGK